MSEPVEKIDPELRLAQLLGDDFLAQAPAAAAPAAAAPNAPLTGNLFDDLLNKSISALVDVSRTETLSNKMVNSYLRGEVELHEVMLAQSKMSIQIQLAMTVINSAVTSFKEITQMQV